MATDYADQVSEAVATLFSYEKEPYIARYLQKNGIPAYYRLKDLRSIVRDALLGAHPSYRLELGGLVDYLDELQETGRAHVFLFRAREDSRSDLLAKARDAKHIRSRLGSLGLDGLYNSRRFVWDAEIPELAEVRHDSQAGILVLKWVQTRAWLKKAQQSNSSQAGQITKVWHQREERSANFFCLNLQSGASEILIQKLRENAKERLRDELVRYQGLATELLGLDVFAPVLLEPIIRRALATRDARIKAWAIATPDRGKLDAKNVAAPTLPREVDAGSFSGLLLEYEWQPQEDAKERRTIPVKLNGRTDQIDILKPCLPDHHRSILSEIRSWSDDAIADRDLQKIAAGAGELMPVILKIDSHLSRLRKRTLEVRDLVDDEWRHREEVLRAFEVLQKQNPEKFRVAYYIVDPETRRPVTDIRGVAEYRERREIPEEIEVKRKRKVACVRTEGNVEVRLVVQQQEAQLIPAEPEDSAPVEVVPPGRADKIVAGTMGTVLILVSLLLAIYYPEPTPFREFVFRVILAFAAAGLGATLPGTIQLQLKKRNMVLVRAVGAVALFVLVYVFNPPALVQQSQGTEGQAVSTAGPASDEVRQGIGE